MNMKKTGFRKSIGGVLLAVLSNVAVAQHPLPEFHMLNQSLSSSFLSADVDVFSLGGLEDLGSSYEYEATFEGISGAAIGFFTVLTMDTPFSPLDVSAALNGDFFSGMTPTASFEFMTTPGKYHVAVVSGLTGSSMNANYNLHISPVPEAEMWGMMLVGLGLVGAVVTRSQRRNVVPV